MPNLTNFLNGPTRWDWVVVVALMAIGAMVAMPNLTVDAQSTPDATWGNAASTVANWFQQNEPAAYAKVSELVQNMRNHANTNIQAAGDVFHEEILLAAGAIRPGDDPDTVPPYQDLANAFRDLLSSTLPDGTTLDAASQQAIFDAAKTEFLSATFENPDE